MSEPLGVLSDDELRLVGRMRDQLDRADRANRLVEAYYEGSHRAKLLGISIPPTFARVRTVIGWPGIAVDSVEERLDWLGWSGGADMGLDGVFADNGLGVESGVAHLDALIFGVGFVTVSAGLEGEPEVLVAMQSPKAATGIFDQRARRLSAGMVRIAAGDGGGAGEQIEVLLPDQIIRVVRAGQAWRVQDRQEHGAGQVPMVAMPNRRRTSRHSGRSEITRAVRSITDNAVRTLLGMEINREFYSSPQRWAMGADPSEFTREDGTLRTGWEVLLGSVWAIGRDEDGNSPTVGQFAPASPAPYVDQVRALSQLMAAEAACPEHYFGFVTENPSSADAIRAGEARLVKHAERRQGQFGQAWMQVGRLAARILGEDRPDFNRVVSCRWRDAATPTRAAAADATVKLVGAGIMPAAADVTLEMAGLGADEIQRVQAERATAAPSGIDALAASLARQGA